MAKHIDIFNQEYDDELSVDSITDTMFRVYHHPKLKKNLGKDEIKFIEDHYEELEKLYGGESTIDFSRIEDDKYWCFGQVFTLDRRNWAAKLNSDKSIFEMVDQIPAELEQLQYYLAMMQFECEDLTFNIRLLPNTAKWVFEGDNYVPTKEDFQAFIATDAFKKFASAIPKKLQVAFASLREFRRKDVEQAGVSKQELDAVLNSEMRYITIAKGAAAKPTMKEMPQ